MGFMDKVKGLLKGHEKQAKDGIDTVSNKLEEKVGPEHAAQVDAASDKAKDLVDDVSSGDTPATPPAAAPPT
jgi:MT0933-like antitoxin protein